MSRCLGIMVVWASLASVALADHWTMPKQVCGAAEELSFRATEFHRLLHEMRNIPEIASDFRNTQMLDALTNDAHRLDDTARWVAQNGERNPYATVFNRFSPIRQDFKHMREGIKNYLPAIKVLLGRYLSQKYGIWEVDYRWYRVAFSYEKLEYNMTEGDAIGDVGHDHGHNESDDHSHR